MNKTFVIAEIGQAHDGSLGILHSYIDAVAKTGVDAIKFQTHIAEAESSIYEPFRVKFSKQDKTRFDYWQRMEFSLEQWKGIKEHCDEVGLEFMSSPFSMAAVDLLEEVGINKYKIGSGEVSNYLMLEKIAKTGKEIILSSGMSSYQEIEDSIKFLDKFDNKLNLMQCTTQYPSVPETVGLNVVTEMIERFDLPIGFSDHSGTITPSIAAVTLGAKLIEVHTVFNKQMFGPDTTSSLTIDELKQLVDSIRFLDTAFENPVDKKDNSRFSELKGIFEKSLSINKAKGKGDVIEFSDLESKKPAGRGIPATNYGQVIGKKLSKDIEKFDFLTNDYIE